MLLAGCQKFGGVGSAIKFTASTRQDVAETKTAYSGVVDGSNFERIDWVAGDQILLAMKNDDVNYAQQAYEITGITAAGKNSKAGLQMPGGGTGGLQWGTGTHDFWAAYPSTATVGDHTFKSNIPAVQTLTYKTKTNNTLIYAPDMTKAMMVAGLQSAPASSGVNLDFEPAFTAFDFTVGANTDVIIESFTMETTTSGEASKNILTGDATATFNTGTGMARTYSATGTTGQSITTAFSPAAALSTTTSLNFKVFAVPQAIKGVTIAFTFSPPTSKTLKLRLKYSGAGDWLEFAACKKFNITGLLVPGAEWTITMDGPRVEQWTIAPEVEFGVE